MGEEKDCAMCELLKTEMPEEVRPLMMYGIGKLAGKYGKEPDMCLTHEATLAALETLLSVMSSRLEKKPADTSGTEGTMK